jgi:hypothetical protein
MSVVTNTHKRYFMRQVQFRFVNQIPKYRIHLFFTRMTCRIIADERGAWQNHNKKHGNRIWHIKVSAFLFFFNIYIPACAVWAMMKCYYNSVKWSKSPIEIWWELAKGKMASYIRRRGAAIRNKKINRKQ